MNLKEPSQLGLMQSKISRMLDIFKGENVNIEDYYMALLFLSLGRVNLLGVAYHHTGQEYYGDLEKSLKEYETEESLRFLPIIPHFENSIKKLSHHGLNQLISDANGFRLRLSQNLFPEIFDQMLYAITKGQGRHGGEMVQPLELTKFLIQLADLPVTARVFNPFAGLVSFGVFLNANQSYYGQELDPKTWAIGQLRLIAYDRHEFSQFVCEDSVENWPNSRGNFDLVISHPPFVNYSLSGRSNPLSRISQGHRTYESFLLDEGIQLLKRNGKLIAILPQGFLFRGDQEKLRKNLIKNDLIDTIISLPGGALSYTGIPIIILVINLKKEYPNLIRLIDASNLIEKRSLLEKEVDYAYLNKLIDSPFENSEKVRIVSPEQVKQNEYNLNIPRYFQKKIEGLKLKNLLEFIEGRKASNISSGRILRIRDLKENEINFNLDVSEIESIENRGSLLWEINESCLLLATKWRTLKPTWFDYKEDSIFIRYGDIHAFKINEKLIDKGYLINELQSDYVKEQLSAFRVGTTIPYITIKDLLNVVVKVPSLGTETSLDLQKSKIEGTTEEFLKFREKEKSEIEKLKEVIENQNRDFQSLTHTIRQYLSPLKSNVSGTRKFLKNHDGKPISLNMIYSKNLNQTMEEHLNSIEKIIDSINNLILSNEQRVLETGSSNLFDLVENCLNKFKEEDIFSFVNPEIDEESFVDGNENFVSPIIGLSEEQFETLLSNVIDNAKKYGFKGRFKGNLIKISINHESGFIYLRISNNGHPFDKGFTLKHLITLGEKTTDSLGSGIGGADIKKIVDSARGSFDILSDSNEPVYKVSYIFKFPLIIDEK